MAQPKWTQAHYDALKEAIALGALRVEYADKRIEYRSLDDMQRLLEEMATDLGLNAEVKNRRRRIGNFTKGF
jgi:hypothetical protein